MAQERGTDDGEAEATHGDEAIKIGRTSIPALHQRSVGQVVVVIELRLHPGEDELLLAPCVNLGEPVEVLVVPDFLEDYLEPLRHEGFAEAVRIAQAEFDKYRPTVVVGSSRGGAVAMSIKSGGARLVLLCPAWRKFGTAMIVKPGTVILHSRADDVIPFAHSEELVRNSGLPASALVEVGVDHRLADLEALEAMLRACKYAWGNES